MKKSVFDLDGEKINAYDAAIERLFSTIMEAPTNRLSRSPAFRQFYWRFIEENIAYFDDTLRSQIKDQAKASKLDKRFIKKLDTTGKVTADEGKLLTMDNLDELDTAAKAYSLTETKGLLYLLFPILFSVSSLRNCMIFTIFYHFEHFMGPKKQFLGP